MFVYSIFLKLLFLDTFTNDSYNKKRTPWKQDRKISFKLIFHITPYLTYLNQINDAITQLEILNLAANSLIHIL